MRSRFKQTNRFSIIAFVSVIALVTAFGSWSCSPQRYSGPMESITRIRDYVTGIDALNAALKDEVDIAGMAEWAIVVGAFRKDKFSLITNIDKWQAVYIVARRDRGIENISDLKGKTVGLSRGTIAKFYLGRFLDLHGMNIRDLTLVNATPSQSVDMISKRDVDAVITWQPFVNEM